MLPNLLGIDLSHLGWWWQDEDATMPHLLTVSQEPGVGLVLVIFCQVGVQLLPKTGKTSLVAKGTKS